MEELKKVFGDKALTYTELETLLKDNKEVKLANLVSGNYVDKSKFMTAETKSNELEKQLELRDKDLEKLKKVDVSTIKDELDNLKTKYTEDTQNYENKLKTQAINNQIDIALIGVKAKNMAAAKALLKTDAISLDGENVIGLSEQIKIITKENPFLFGEEQSNPPPPIGGSSTAFADETIKWRLEADLPIEK